MHRLLGSAGFVLMTAALAAAQNSTLHAVNTVVLGGAGPAPYFERAIDKLADLLKDGGVNVRVSPGGDNARTGLLAQMKISGESNLLYVTFDRPRDGGNAESSRGTLTVECYADAKKEWSEKTKGPLLVPGSIDHQVDRMVDAMVAKINKRAGGPCLSK
jgi:hypothetical protein